MYSSRNDLLAASVESRNGNLSKNPKPGMVTVICTLNRELFQDTKFLKQGLVTPREDSKGTRAVNAL